MANTNPCTFGITSIPKTNKNQYSEKMNKNAEDIIIYTCVPKTAIIEV